MDEKLIALRCKVGCFPFQANEVGGFVASKAHRLVVDGLAEYFHPSDAPDFKDPAAPKAKAPEPEAETKAVEEAPKHKAILDAPAKKGR